MASGKRKKGRASRPPTRKPVLPLPVTPRPPSSKRPPSKPPSSGPPSPRSEPARSARDVYRARRIRTGITALVMVVVLSVTTVVLVYLHRLNPQERRLLAEAPAAARSAGCRPVRTISPYPGGLDRAHIGTGGPVPTLPELATYPSDPPASGPHSSVPADAGEYADPPSIAEAIHSLEHGAAIIWLSPDALSNAEVARDRK